MVVIFNTPVVAGAVLDPILAAVAAVVPPVAVVLPLAAVVPPVAAVVLELAAVVVEPELWVGVASPQAANRGTVRRTRDSTQNKRFSKVRFSILFSSKKYIKEFI
jgi:hypothetical protein